MFCHSIRSLFVATGLFAAGCAIATEQEVVYTARTGDTLIALEKRFLANPYVWKNLKTRNRIVDPMRIPVGTAVRIPVGWLRAEPLTARVVAMQGDVSMDGRALKLDSKVPAGALLRTGTGAFAQSAPQRTADDSLYQALGGKPGLTTLMDVPVEGHAVISDARSRELYIKRMGVTGMYPAMYYSHNLHFLVESYNRAGNYSKADRKSVV